MELDKLDLFGSVNHEDDNSDSSVDLPANATDLDMLDYMALTVARVLTCDKAFKGGYMLNQLLGEDSRLTHDIDLSIMNEKAYDSVKKVLRDIAERFVSLGLIRRYDIREDITPTSSGGIKMYDNNGRVILGVDVGLHSLLYGVSDYNLKFGVVRAFSVERMMSDKVLAILSCKRFRRTKDLYDVYAITNAFDLDFKELLYCVENRNNYDSAIWGNIPFSETALTEYTKAWDRLHLIAPSGDEIEKPMFNDAIARFSRIAYALKDRREVICWSHISKNWMV